MNPFQGISFLSMKNMLIIEYLTNLIQLVYMKMNGKQIGSNNQCVQRLAEIRCVNNNEKKNHQLTFTQFFNILKGYREK
jgi:hypothetical protein